VRIARFAKGDGVAYGVVEGSGPGLTISELYGHPFGVDPGGVRLTGSRYPLAEVRLLAPVLPSKVVAAGRNYASHAREMNTEPPAEPVLFLKPSTSVTGPGDAIKYPVKLTERVDFEGELAVIIGRLCRGVPRERAEEVIFGYTCANDVTARDLQARDGQWTRAKGFDTFCPLGPWMETGTNPADLELVTTVNGAVRQQAHPGQRRTHRHAAVGRQPAELYREQDDRHQPDPEPGSRVEQQHHNLQDSIRPAPGEDRHDPAGEDADDERHAEG